MPGIQIERDRVPAQELEEHRKLDRALSALAPQRPGVVDAYVVSIALDSDPVFGREARAAGDVLQRRYGATGRTIVLAGTDGSAPSALPRGIAQTRSGIALARIAELMDETGGCADPLHDQPRRAVRPLLSRFRQWLWRDLAEPASA